MTLQNVAADDVSASNGGEHEIDIFNESFERRALQFACDRVTGREIIQKLGSHPIEDFIVLHWHHDGAVEDVGLDEPIDLKGRKLSAFFVNMASETFNIVINDVRVTWTQAVVTGETLKRLARVPIDKTDLFLVRPSVPEKLIEDEEKVDLDHRGLEHFRTRLARIVEITVNVTHKVKIQRGIRTGAEIKTAAIAQGVPIDESFTLSQELPDGGSKVIGNDDPVRIKGGEEFLAIDDHDDSQR